MMHRTLSGRAVTCVLPGTPEDPEQLGLKPGLYAARAGPRSRPRGAAAASRVRRPGVGAEPNAPRGRARRPGARGRARGGARGTAAPAAPPAGGVRAAVNPRPWRDGVCGWQARRPGAVCRSGLA
jgi:hypothetical protein